MNGGGQFVLTRALTCVLSPEAPEAPEERIFTCSAFCDSIDRPPIPPLDFSRTRGTFLPLLGGEGRGEGGRETLSAARELPQLAAAAPDLTAWDFSSVLDGPRAADWD